MKERILVVDDEPGVRTALEGILGDEGFSVVTVGSGEEAVEATARSTFDAVLLDVWLPGIDGIETLSRLRDLDRDLEVVMISGHGTIETAVRATKRGAFDFVEKPLSLEKTLLVLRNALRQRRLERRNRRLLEQLDRQTEILGRSAGMDKVRAEVGAAAGSDAPVLILGERGTGRETIARRIHASSARSEEAFVEIPCAALDQAAAVAALFGDSAGRGRLQLADKGSLFLDQVDRLPGSLQRRLAGSLDLRVEGTPDIRPLASAGLNAPGLEEGLRQRLDVLRIVVPPLRERREDVPLIVERFMRDLSHEYGRSEKRLEPKALGAMQAFGWPGNVRELRNLIERLVLLAPGESIGVGDLPEELGGARGPAEDLYREFASLAEGLETFERYYIRRVLAELQGDRAAAAVRLGIPPDLLGRKLDELELA